MSLEMELRLLEKGSFSMALYVYNIIYKDIKKRLHVMKT